MAKAKDTPDTTPSVDALLEQLRSLSAQVQELQQLQADAAARIPTTPPPSAVPTDVETLVQAIAKVTRPNLPGGRVGVRNISDSVIGFMTPEGEVQLLCPRPGVAEPRVAAEIPYAFWQTIRKGSVVANGLMVRDDTILDPSAPRAPEDRAEDLAPGFYVNAIEDPHEWITSKTEAELEAAIMAITSEASLERIRAAVTQKIYQIGEERFQDDPQRGKKAIRALPALYRKAEECVLDRYEEMHPIDFADEAKSLIRF